MHCLESLLKRRMTVCAVCETALIKLTRCSRCHTEYYCSQSCQKMHWPVHREICRQLTAKNSKPDSRRGSQSQYFISYIGAAGKIMKESTEVALNKTNCRVNIKHNSKKLPLDIHTDWNGLFILKLISQCTQIPVMDMRVIMRGKTLDQSNINQHITNNSNIMVIGRAVQSCQGLDERDIQCIMGQMPVDRNQAILALRKCGSPMDAIIELGNR